MNKKLNFVLMLSLVMVLIAFAIISITTHQAYAEDPAVDPNPEVELEDGGVEDELAEWWAENRDWVISTAETTLTGVILALYYVATTKGKKLMTDITKATGILANNEKSNTEKLEELSEVKREMLNDISEGYSQLQASLSALAERLADTIEANEDKLKDLETTLSKLSEEEDKVGKILRAMVKGNQELVRNGTADKIMNGDI